MISFRLACVPPTGNHQRKKIVTIRTATNEFHKLADTPQLNHAKRFLEELLIPHQPAAPIAGPVVLTIEYTWPWLASHGKKIRAQPRIPHISKPDLTNVTKTLEDRLCELLFIEDDRKVVDLHVRKWWGNEPGIAITIAPFEPTSIAQTAPPHWQADALPLLDTRGESLYRRRPRPGHDERDAAPVARPQPLAQPQRRPGRLGRHPAADDRPAPLERAAQQRRSLGLVPGGPQPPRCQVAVRRVQHQPPPHRHPMPVTMV